MALESNGRFVWYELMTRDKEADLGFMKALAGWTSVEQGMGEMGTYTIISAGETGIGGCMDLPAEAGDTPSHFIGYCEVEDIEAVAKAAEASGGKIFVPPTHIPGTGTFSVMADPAGATFAGLQSESETPVSAPARGHFVWNEVVTPDVPATGAFYRKVLGWKVDEVDMAGRPYWLFTHPSQQNNSGGMMPNPAEYDGPAFWLPYVMVDDVDAATASVTGLGGRVHMQPEDVPGQGRASVIATPSGATLALFTSSRV